MLWFSMYMHDRYFRNDFICLFLIKIWLGQSIIAKENVWNLEFWNVVRKYENVISPKIFEKILGHSKNT